MKIHKLVISTTLIIVAMSVLSPAFATDQSHLPKVLIIGDSISIGYTPFVTEFLEGKAIVKHNTGNAQDTNKGLSDLTEWLAADNWEIIHFNWGLWDMRYDNGFDSPPRIPLADYKANLTKLVKQLKSHPAKLIFANTTPVPTGAKRRIPGTELKYNRAALEIMTNNNIPVNNLHQLINPQLPKYQRKADVHFNKQGSQTMAQLIADSIAPLLRWPRHVIDESSKGADGVKLADVNNDGLMDIATGWEEGGITRAYINPGYDKAKQKWPAVTAGITPGVEDAVFIDLDNDGAVDVVTSCEGKKRSLNIHWAPKQNYLDSQAWKTNIIGDSAQKTAWMFCTPLQVDKINGIDLVAASKGSDGTIGWYESPKDPRKTADYKWHEISKAGWIMSLIATDMDNDGDADILTTDRKGDMRGVRWLENPGPGQKQTQKWKNHFVGAKDSEVMFMKVTDFDNDNLDDIIVAAKKGKDTKRILYFRRLDKTGFRWKENSFAFTHNTGTAKDVAIGDLDHDGNDDIVFSCENANNPKSGLIWIKQNTATSKWNSYEISGPQGIKYDRIELLDIDGDSDLDVLTCEERDKNTKGQKGGMGVFWYENTWGKN